MSDTCHRIKRLRRGFVSRAAIVLLIIFGAWVRFSLYHRVNFPISAEGRLFIEKLYTHEDVLFGGGHFVRALNIVNGGGFLSEDDFVNPPGATVLIAVLLKVGLSPPSIQLIWYFASIVAMILSCLMLRHWLSTTWQIAAMLLIVVDISAASYSAYITSEVPAMLLVALGFYFISKSLRVSLNDPKSEVSLNRAIQTAGLGGVFVGLSTFFWSMGLGIVIGLISLGLLARNRTQTVAHIFFRGPEWRRIWSRAASRSFFTVCILTTIVFLFTGRIGATNFGYPSRLLMAHIREPRVVTFENKATGGSQSFGLTYHYQRRAIQNYQFPFPASDQLLSLREAVKILRNYPVQFLNTSLVNAYNLFSGNIGWPNFTSPLRRAVEFGEIGFLYFVIVPLGALIFFILMRDGPRESPVVAMALIIGIFFIFGLFQPGETRFRVPLDGVLVFVSFLLIQGYAVDGVSSKRKKIS